MCGGDGPRPAVERPDVELVLYSFIMLSAVIFCGGSDVLPVIGWYEEEKRLVVLLDEVDGGTAAGGPLERCTAAAAAAAVAVGAQAAACEVKPAKLCKTGIGELAALGRNCSSAAASAATRSAAAFGGGSGGVRGRWAFSFQLARRASGVSRAEVGTTSRC